MPQIVNNVVQPVNPRYYALVKRDGYFFIPEFLRQKWCKDNEDVLIVDLKTVGTADPICSMYTRYELEVEAKKVDEYLVTYQYGRSQMSEVKGIKEERFPYDNWRMQLLKRFHPDWLQLMDLMLTSNYFVTLNKVTLKKDRERIKVLPEQAKVYRAFETSPYNVKIVILGQDPYPNKHANGLAFSTELEDMPPSLMAMWRALGGPTLFDQSLSQWVNQGVMLLNSALTVQSGEPGTYTNDWHDFISDVIFKLCELPRPIIFVLLGSKAQNFEAYIDQQRHFVFKREHPARAVREGRDWMSNRLFGAINNQLKRTGTTGIDWTEPQPEPKEFEQRQLAAGEELQYEDDDDQIPF